MVLSIVVAVVLQHNVVLRTVNLITSVISTNVDLITILFTLLIISVQTNVQVLLYRQTDVMDETVFFPIVESRNVKKSFSQPAPFVLLPNSSVETISQMNWNTVLIMLQTHQTISITLLLQAIHPVLVEPSVLVQETVVL